MDVVIVGRPNTGKSSLLNYLTRKNRSYCHRYTRHNRDVIEETVNIGEYP